MRMICYVSQHPPSFPYYSEREKTTLFPRKIFGKEQPLNSLIIRNYLTDTKYVSASADIILSYSGEKSMDDVRGK